MTFTMAVDSGSALLKEDFAFCERILPEVSRTFAIGIQLLPEPLSRSVTVAYLLCRIADTVEDSVDLLPEEKGYLLALFVRCAEDRFDDCIELRNRFASHRSDEELLVFRADAVLRVFRSLSSPEREAIRGPLREMCEGMAAFALVREGAKQRGVPPISTFEELERYCYHVAGTVGRLLTDLFLLHVGDAASRNAAALVEDSRGFGRGLQLTNIVRDLGDDLSRDVSYVPQELSLRFGLGPGQLLSAEHRPQALRVIDTLIVAALGGLDAGTRYCVRLPRRQVRIRLFCVLPLFLAYRTLGLIRRQMQSSTPFARVKVPRREVYALLALGTIVAPSNRLIVLVVHALTPKTRSPD